MEAILISIAGAAILLLFGILGYFLRIQHTDIRNAIAEQGKLKGKIELIETKITGDLTNLQQLTQLEIKNMAANITTLSKSVNKLVTALAQRNIIDSQDED